MEANKKKIENLKQKIRDFNELMKDLSEEFTSIFKKENKEEFRDVLLEMLKSLDKAQQTVKIAYNLSLTEDINDN